MRRYHTIIQRTGDPAGAGPRGRRAHGRGLAAALPRARRRRALLPEPRRHAERRRRSRRSPATRTTCEACSTTIASTSSSARATLEHDKRFWLSVGRDEARAQARRAAHHQRPRLRRGPERDHGRATHTYRVHYRFDYYRFSEQAVREVFFEGMRRVRVKPVMFPPRIFGHGLQAAGPPSRRATFAARRAAPARRAGDPRQGPMIEQLRAFTYERQRLGAGRAQRRPRAQGRDRRLQLAPVGAALAARPREEDDRGAVPQARRPAAAGHAQVDPPAAGQDRPPRLPRDAGPAGRPQEADEALQVHREALRGAARADPEGRDRAAHAARAAREGRSRAGGVQGRLRADDPRRRARCASAPRGCARTSCATWPTSSSEADADEALAWLAGEYLRAFGPDPRQGLHLVGRRHRRPAPSRRSPRTTPRSSTTAC